MNIEEQSPDTLPWIKAHEDFDLLDELKIDFMILYRSDENSYRSKPGDYLASSRFSFLPVKTDSGWIWLKRYTLVFKKRGEMKFHSRGGYWVESWYPYVKLRKVLNEKLKSPVMLPFTKAIVEKESLKTILSKVAKT